MKLVIDMNLSPAWASVLNQAGHAVVHWLTIGSPHATDREILTWARKHKHVVFTHDLDFGAILAATEGDSPSVVQIRTEDPTPDHCAQIVIETLRLNADYLAAGALISVDEDRARVRRLPLKREAK
jgi:predicted nuclease of predicted toxin-antitoxin system